MKALISLYFVFLGFISFSQNCDALIKEIKITHDAFIKKSTKELKDIIQLEKKVYSCKSNLPKYQFYQAQYLINDCYFDFYAKKYQTDSSIYFGKEAIRYADSSKNLNYRSISRSYLALFYYNINQLDSAIINYKKALTFDLTDTLKTNKCFAYFGLASCYSRLANDSLCLHYNKVALNLSDSLKNPLQHSRILMLNGVLFLSKGELVNSLVFLNRAKSTIENNKDEYRSHYLAVNIHLVNAYLEIKLYDKANELLINSEEYAKNSPYYHACFLMNKGIIAYSGYSKNNEAKYLLNEAIESFKENPAFTDISTCYFYLGIINTEEKNYDLAEENLLKAIEIEEQGSNYNLASSYRSLAYVYYLKEDLALSKEVLSKSLNNSPNNYTLKEIYDLYSKIYAQEKDYKKGLVYRNKADSLYSMIKGESVSKEINQLVYINDQLLIEKEKEKILEKNKAEKKQLYFTISLLVVGFLLALSFVIVLYQRNKFNKQKAYLSSKEIEIKKLKLEVKNKKLDELNESIASQNELIKNLKEGSSEKLSKQTINELTKNSSSGENWMKFMVEFNKLHEGYLDRLKTSFKGLTKNDLRFIALAKLNLGDSEIARLINVEYESVRKIKYRIKNKLGLNSFDDLLII